MLGLQARGLIENGEQNQMKYKYYAVYEPGQDNPAVHSIQKRMQKITLNELLLLVGR